MSYIKTSLICLLLSLATLSAAALNLTISNNDHVQFTTGQIVCPGGNIPPVINGSIDLQLPDFCGFGMTHNGFILGIATRAGLFFVKSCDSYNPYFSCNYACDSANKYCKLNIFKQNKAKNYSINK